MDTSTRLICVRFRPAWGYIDGVREFCRFVCSTTFEKEELAERIGVVVQEMLELALRQSTGQGVELGVNIESDSAQIEVTVECEPAPGVLEMLKSDLAELAEGPLEQAYARALQRAADASADGLRHFGLARIMCEGAMELHLTELDGGKRALLLARGTL